MVINLIFNDYELGLIQEALVEKEIKKRISLNETLQEHADKMWELRKLFYTKKDLYR